MFHRLTCLHVKRKILLRYLIAEVVPPFFLGLLAFTSVLLVARMLKLIELVVTRGVPFLQVGKLFGLILPTFLEMTVPMAFLLAILLGLGRLSNDQELLAMKASGISPTQILWPIACLAWLIAIATLFLTMYARPAANFALKKELYNIAKSRVGTALKEKVFNDDFPKILIYVEEVVPPGSTAQGVLIVDKRDKTREDIILGKVARITTDESGPKEMALSELLSAIAAKQDGGVQTIAERMELHQRISFGFAPLVFCLLGVSLTLIPRASRTNRSWGFMLCLFWLMTYYTLLSLGKALGDKNILHPIPALWLPNLVVGGIGAQFFRHALRESPLYFPRTLERATASTVEFLRNFKKKK